MRPLTLVLVVMRPRSVVGGAVSVRSRTVAIVIDVGVVRGDRVASNGDVIRRHILPRHNTGNEVGRSDDKNQQSQHGGESSPAKEILTYLPAKIMSIFPIFPGLLNLLQINLLKLMT